MGGRREAKPTDIHINRRTGVPKLTMPLHRRLKATILGCPKPPQPCFLHRKTTIFANALHQLRFRHHFGEAFPPIRCLPGRFRLDLQGPFSAPEPSQSSKCQIHLVPQRPQSRAGDPKPTKRCPETDDAASPECPKATILGDSKPPKPCFLHRKIAIFANAPNSVPTPHFGEEFPLIRCLLGRIRLALQGPCGTPEPSKGTKQSHRPTVRCLQAA